MSPAVLSARNTLFPELRGIGISVEHSYQLSEGQPLEAQPDDDDESVPGQINLDDEDDHLLDDADLGRVGGTSEGQSRNKTIAQRREEMRRGEKTFPRAKDPCERCERLGRDCRRSAGQNCVDCFIAGTACDVDGISQYAS